MNLPELAVRLAGRANAALFHLTRGRVLLLTHEDPPGLTVHRHGAESARFAYFRARGALVLIGSRAPGPSGPEPVTVELDGRTFTASASSLGPSEADRLVRAAPPALRVWMRARGVTAVRTLTP
ncbi:hypothetical protein [Actinomadura flavalba]|uniref:hypothetical protein n=1 Tax=Actinomadura flavalba TaxID=1120938 RepID=UPI00035DEFB6|nr:hypothetical protein [Actinomadura flavalba]